MMRGEGGRPRVHRQRVGFDVVDLGPLAEGWRIQRDTPGYNARLGAEELRGKIAEA